MVNIHWEIIFWNVFFGKKHAIFCGVKKSLSRKQRCFSVCFCENAKEKPPRLSKNTLPGRVHTWG